jgi:hypothetical protein
LSSNENILKARLPVLGLIKVNTVCAVIQISVYYFVNLHTPYFSVPLWLSVSI